MFNTESISIFQLNKYVLERNLKGLTQEDALVSPLPGGNCINWIVGHILVSRDDLRDMLGLQRVCSDEMTALYRRGSGNVNSVNSMNISELLDIYNSGQQELEDCIGETDFTGSEKALKDLATLAFHEAYHIGQTGLLRRIAGKEGAIK